VEAADIRASTPAAISRVRRLVTVAPCGIGREVSARIVPNEPGDKARGAAGLLSPAILIY